MPFRFRRSIRVLPFLRLNIGKRGASVSVGGRGAHVTLGRGQVRETVGIPGSGLSYTHVDKTAVKVPGQAQPQGVIEPLPKGVAWRGWLWIAVLAAIVATIAYGVAKASPPDADDTLLKAINFALTGSDRVTYSFVNRVTCIVEYSQPSSEPGIQAVDTFYLNHIDLSRITWQEMESKSQYGTDRIIRVQLHGETVIREHSFVPPAATVWPLNDEALDLKTTERDRLIRAWRYIYTHGCKSAHSSY